MLSYATILAIQVLYLLNRVDEQGLTFWGATTQTAIPHAIRFNQHLGLQFSETLKNITLKELITETIFKAPDRMAGW